jgi:hypothetical protein
MNWLEDIGDLLIPKRHRQTSGEKMPLRSCKGCGRKINTAADECPYCGKRRWKRRYSKVLGVLMILIALLILIAMIPSEPSRPPSDIQIPENNPLDTTPDKQNI